MEIKWDVSAVSMVPDTLFLPDTVSPVQESSTDTKGQQSALSCPASDEPRSVTMGDERSLGRSFVILLVVILLMATRTKTMMTVIASFYQNHYH